jgi:hypothetical protein
MLIALLFILKTYIGNWPNQEWFHCVNYLTMTEHIYTLYLGLQVASISSFWFNFCHVLWPVGGQSLCIFLWSRSTNTMSCLHWIQILSFRALKLCNVMFITWRTINCPLKGKYILYIWKRNLYRSLRSTYKICVVLEMKKSAGTTANLSIK